jgi:membrane-associated phospholipid phosphatase
MDRKEIVERTGGEVAHRARHLLAWRFQIAVALAGLGFGVLALLARTVWYFPVDLELTRAIQGMRAPWLDGLLGAVTWVGFPPQSNLIFGLVILGLFLLGQRLEALMTAFAAAGSAGLWYLIAPLVGRPRPSPELVDVAMQIPHGSFPSGHVLNLTAIFGFLIYLTILLVPWTLARRALVTLLVLPILTIGFARVEAGAHWPSDVLGGYMLGGIWLALTIHLYRWLKQRLSGRHGERAGGPVAALLTAPGRGLRATD